MRFQKKIDYYLENGPEKVKPIKKENMMAEFKFYGEGLDGIFNSPVFWSEDAILNAIENSSINLLKYYPWKLYVDIAEHRKINISNILNNLPYYNFFEMVDEDEYPEGYWDVI